MTNKEFNLYVLSNFPNLMKSFKNNNPWDDYLDSGKNIIIGTEFTPYFILKINENNKQNIEECCSFIDTLYEMNDNEILNVIYVSVIELLKDNNIDISSLPFQSKF